MIALFHGMQAVIILLCNDGKLSGDASNYGNVPKRAMYTLRTSLKVIWKIVYNNFLYFYNITGRVMTNSYYAFLEKLI